MWYDGLIVALRERMDYEALFGEFVEWGGRASRGGERMAKCVFHDDQSPSMGVNVEEGVYCCHVPDCGAQGDFISFYQRVRSLTFVEALSELARRVGLDADVYRENVQRAAQDPHALMSEQERLLATYAPGAVVAARPARGPEVEPDPEIDEAIVEAFHHRLLSTQTLMDFLNERRGLTRETIQRYEIGHDGSRFQIPVRNEDGTCVNIRRYKPDARRAQDKMISWRTGFGQARLYPLHRLRDEDTVFLFEGEMDCLLALQLGINALTTTGGAGTWRDQWNPVFEGKKVVICYDADEAGRVGGAQVASQLSGVASEVRVVQIPLAEPVGADFTDYIHGHGLSLADFLLLVERTAPFQAGGSERLSAQEGADPIPLHLSQASRAEYNNTPIRVNVMVSGKTTAPFIVPKEVKMNGCGMPGLKMCERCPVAENGGQVIRRLEFENNEVLQFINITQGVLTKALKQWTGVPAKCGYVRGEILEAINVEEVQLIPEVERTDAEAPYVTRAAYYVGHGLQANRSYVMTGVTVPEPKRQLATHVIHSAVQSQSNIDAFRLTEDVVERLKVFRPTEPGVQGLWRHLASMYDDLERHTRIYQRRDLMLTVDLVYHSVIQFRLQGELLQRGWTEALIIGDSRTGKTTIVQRIMDYYGAGEFSTGENTSLAGLVGGLHQIGTSWVLQWGRIPLNDRRLLTIDEAGNLPSDQIARMSSMRSSGVAEIVKVHTEKTNARTRGIWISNPRSPRPLSSFSQGVLAVKELIGAPEDIARFDMVCSAASGDVPLAVVNAQRGNEQPEVYTSELCHQRVMWAWSRSSDQITWAEGATEAVLRIATEQGERYRYATEIPLVEPNEQRVKLARLAVSAAALFFSSSEDGHQVVVRPEHVEFASQFLETLYSKPSMSFLEYADHQRSRYAISREEVVATILNRNQNAVHAFMEQEQFTQRDLQEILSFNDRDDLRDAITKLRDAGFLRRQGSSFYLKTPAAIRWLREEVVRRAGVRGGYADFAEVMGDVPPEDPPF